MGLNKTPLITKPHPNDAGSPNYRSPITIRWRDTLYGSDDHGYYEVQIDTNLNFPTSGDPGGASGNKRIKLIDLWDNLYPARLEIELPEDSWYVRVREWRAVTETTEGSWTKEAGPWSPTVFFKIDFDTALNPETYWLEESRNKFIPVVYGVFNRDMVNPTLSNGLTPAYLATFAGTATYFVASHPCNANAIQIATAEERSSAIQLYIPTPGIPEIPLAVLSEHLDDGNLLSGSIQWHTDDSNRFITSRNFKLSTVSPLNTPLAEDKWLATDRNNIIDDDASTVATTVVWGGTGSEADAPEKKWFGPLSYWQSYGSSAWEISDTEQILGGLFRPDAFTEIYAHYRDLHLIPTPLPDGFIKDLTELDMTFRIVNSVNNDNLDEVPGRLIGRVTSFDNKDYVTVGPLRTAAAGSSTNRDFAFMVACAISTSADPSAGSNLLTIADVRLTVNQIFSGDEQRNALVAYAGIQGRMYGSWLSNFNSAGGMGARLNNLYNSVKFNAMTIEDPAMIVASLCIDYAGYSIGNFDTTSFEDAIAMLDNRMRISITEDDVTVRDVIEEIIQQVPFNFVVTPSGQVKLINIRTVIKYIDTIHARPLYSDMKAGSFKLKKTPLDKVVNVLPIKSRWQAEVNRFVDFDEYKNTTSIQKYGERRPKAPLEFKYVNGGPHDKAPGVSLYFAHNVTTRLAHNPVKWQAVHLIEPDEVNAQSDAYHIHDDGWLSNQHNEISLELPGYEFMSLEIGDLMVLDNTSFAANSLTCFGESWASKRFMIQSITKDQDGVKIQSAIQLPKYENFFALRGMSTWSQP